MTPEQLADDLVPLWDNGAFEREDAEEAAAELRRLAVVENAFNEWHTKTAWVQDTTQAKELGMHRADVLRSRIDQILAENRRLAAENAALRKDAERWKQLAHMEANRAAPEILADYIARPERLDYAAELRNHHDAAMQKEKS